MSKDLDENYFYNSMLAQALVQLLAPNERKIIRTWFTKLLSLDNTSEEKELRNDYMWFILLMLQCQKIREPFNSIPPPDLGPLRDLVPTKVYEEVLVANDDNMPIFDKGDKKVQFKQSAPAQFFKNQPLPHEVLSGEVELNVGIYGDYPVEIHLVRKDGMINTYVAKPDYLCMGAKVEVNS